MGTDQQIHEAIPIQIKHFGGEHLSNTAAKAIGHQGQITLPIIDVEKGVRATHKNVDITVVVDVCRTASVMKPGLIGFAYPGEGAGGRLHNLLRVAAREGIGIIAMIQHKQIHQAVAIQISHQSLARMSRWRWIAIKDGVIEGKTLATVINEHLARYFAFVQVTARSQEDIRIAITVCIQITNGINQRSPPFQTLKR